MSESKPKNVIAKILFYVNIILILLCIISLSNYSLTEKSFIYVPYSLSILGSYLMIYGMRSGHVIFNVSQTVISLLGLIGLLFGYSGFETSDFVIIITIFIFIPLASIILSLKSSQHSNESQNIRPKISISIEESKISEIQKEINSLIQQRKKLSISESNPSILLNASKDFNNKIDNFKSEISMLEKRLEIKKQNKPQIEIYENQRRLNLLTEDEYLKKVEQLIRESLREQK